MSATSHGERGRSRCDDSGGEVSERDDLLAIARRISHDPAESVAREDIEKAIECGMHLLDQLANSAESLKRINLA